MKLFMTLLTCIVPAVTALGKGQFCYFFAPKSANLGFVAFGHIGWGFLVPGTDSFWQYGSAEGGSLWWTSQGNFGAMLDAFVERHITDPVHYPNEYTSYKCLSTDTSAVGGAEKVVASQSGSGNHYDALTNNCLQQANDIAQQYAYYDLWVRTGLDNYINVFPSDFWPLLTVPEKPLAIGIA